ncbi:hypothetical protein GCM10022222_39630 [Amycolatopsis ultiminotia]|uniref:DUF2461 family protein n=1 Tax=Amycolatopsis ultiminotia TaxID=543629 RepID=A0ABP6WK69_9PSEU
MHRDFFGWPEAAFDVLLRLEGDPSTAARESLRKDRERLVRQPMVALMDALAFRSELFEDHSVSGFRSTPWWWQHQCAVVRLAKNVEIGLRFDLDGLRLQGAWWYATPGQVERYRASVADEASGSVLANGVGELVDGGYEITGEKLKRVPQGFSADHPRAELLRHRSLLAVRELGCDDWLHSAEALNRVWLACRELEPVLFWLAKHVAPPGAEDR